MSVEIFGIRHHGPGSARNLVAALQEYQPDVLLIEGPPEGEGLLKWVSHEDMQPPVALLGYRPDEPQQAAFYPFAEFSPEWQAIRYGQAQQIPVRFMDLPLAHSFALEEKEEQEEKEQATEHPSEESIYHNPIKHLADTAGFADAEVWWEQHFELRKTTRESFEAIALAMEALRENLPPNPSHREQLREAYMRKVLRQAEKDGFQKIAIVCGAFHVPALVNQPKVKEDNALLKGLAKVKVETTWIPWTNSRLTFASGYGAGVNSPGWYYHQWNHPQDDGSRWMVHVARVFREAGKDISSAHVIESSRLATALTALRGHHRSGLQEVNEAVLATMCMGDEVLLSLIWKELIVGNATGNTPAEAPQVPLQRDLEQQQKSLRLKVQDVPKALQLDLREERDLQKSILLHRLNLLEVNWGSTEYTAGKGTFKEHWQLRWQPELTIQLLEKAPWGNTVAEAAAAWLGHQASESKNLGQLSELLQKALPADLPQGINALLTKLDRLASGSSDVRELMQAFTPLVQVRRYGNVRNTDTETVARILDVLLARIVAGLPAAVTGIDTDSATALSSEIDQVNSALLLLENEEDTALWHKALFSIYEAESSHPLVAGWCCKLLYQARFISSEEAAKGFSKALSAGANTEYSTGWIEGFLSGSATTLILDDEIWGILDAWLGALSAEHFQEVVPILRRTFSNYANPEKVQLAQKAKGDNVAGAGPNTQPLELDEEKVALLLKGFYQFIGSNE